MKGFDTSVLKPLLEGDLGDFKKAYDEFIKKVERLIELQKEFGSLNTQDFPDEAMKIESMLFSPAHVDEIEELTSEIKQKIKTPPVKKAFEEYFLGDCNKDAYSLYKDQVVKFLGEKYNPFVIYGNASTGRTRFLNEIKIDLEAVENSVLFVDLAGNDISGKFEESSRFDVLIIDNFHKVFTFDDNNRKLIFDVIRNYIDNNKAVIFTSATFPSGEELSEDEKSIFDLGIETGLKEPCAEVAEAYIRMKVAKDQAENIIDMGLPVFVSYAAIDAFIESFDKETAISEPTAASSEIEEQEEEPAKEEKPVEEEIVPLGLAGEMTEPGRQKDEVSADVSEPVSNGVVALGLPDEATSQTENGLDDKEEEKPVALSDAVDVAAEKPDESAVVSLGLPGEETAEKTEDEPEEIGDEQKKKEEKEDKKGKVEPGPVQGEPLKELKEERFIIKEIPGELIEDNF